MGKLQPENTQRHNNHSKHKKKVLLLSMKEQGKQKAQVCVWEWGDLPWPQPRVVADDDPTVQKALGFFIPWARRWTNDEYTDQKEFQAAMFEEIDFEERRPLHLPRHAAGAPEGGGVPLEGGL